MFRYFFRSTEPKKTPNVQEEKPINYESKAKVFVWSGGMDSVGHVALQLEGDNPVDKVNDPDIYISIWPKSTPAGGLTAVVPLQATLCKKIEYDCIQEAPRPKEDFTNLMYPFELEPTPPDRVFDVNGIDKGKIKDEINRLENGIEKGEVRYQLLPGINTAGLFNKIWSKKSEDKPEVYNCVTLTKHLLEVGGENNLPEASWTSPSKFGDVLNDQPNVTQRNSF